MKTLGVVHVYVVTLQVNIFYSITFLFLMLLRTKILATFFSIILLAHCYSQSPEETSLNIIESGMPLSNVNMIGKKATPGKIKGDQYLFETFQEGKIAFANDSYLGKVLINYNAYENYIQFKLDKFERVVEPEFVKLIVVNGTNYSPFFIKGYSGDETLLGEILYESKKVKLMKHIEVILKEPTYIEGVDMGSRDYVYKRSIDYYLSVNAGDYVKLRSSSNRNAKELGRKDVKIFAKENDIDWKSEADLIKVVTYLDSE